MSHVKVVVRRRRVIWSLRDIKFVIRRRDGNRCTQCGLTKQEHVKQTDRQLDVHRLDPSKGYTLANCTTLCRKCHVAVPRRPWGSVSNIIRLDLDPRVRRPLRQLATEENRSPAYMVEILVREALQARGKVR
jgi:5-methylcytosine-specific restriction endonuclease McrA